MANTTNFGWETPDDTDLVKDGAAAMRTLGNAIDTSLVDLKGGTTGQILSKASNTDLDYTWINNDQGDITGVTAGTGISGGGTSGTVTITNSMATEITAAGDIIVGTGSGTFDNLPIGTTGQILTADTTVSPYKVKWAAASSGALTKITSSTFTTSSAVNIDNCFSSSYDNYLVIIQAKPSSGGQNLRLRWRASGSDATGANYDFEYIYTYVTTVAGAGANNATSNAIAYLGDTAQYSYANITVHNPFNAINTTYNGTGISYEGDSSGNLITGNHQSDTSYDGFSIYPQTSGTITGKVTVYGYQI